MQDKALDRQISFTGTELGEEAQTTAWAWNFQYYVTPSDLLALLHRKFGVQIISDHYTEYAGKDSRSMGALPMRNALHQIAAPHSRWGWDGIYVYLRKVDIRNADLCEVPNRLLRHWQSVYRTQGYLGLDELAEIRKLSQPQLAILQRYARLLGLESIDWFSGWSRSFDSEYVWLYGQLSATQREEALAAGRSVAFSAEQSHALEQLMGGNSGYWWRGFKASGLTGKIVAGTYDTLWRRLDQPDDPADVELRPMDKPLGSKPVSLTIRKKPGESRYYWFKELSSPWPQHPELLRDVKNEDELLRRIRSNRRMTLANVRLISADDYEFVLTLADGKTVNGSVSVPLAPVTPPGSVKTGAAAPVVAPVPKEQSQTEGAATLLSKSRGPAAPAQPQTQPPAQAAAPAITNIAMVGGVFFDDVAVINNSKAVMSDDFNSGKLTGWTAPQPRVVVTPVTTNSTNYCLYMNREHGSKTYARHSVQCDDVGALELQAKVFLPQPAEEWSYSHGKRELTGIGLTTGRDEHRFNVQIVLSPGELAYHVELVHLKPEIKEPRGRSETFSSRELVIAPGKWALVSFKLDPSAGTATVYVDGQPHVSCRYDPSKITTLTELYLTTFMGNLEPAVNPKARGLPKESPSRIANLEPTVNAAGEATALAGSPAAAEQLHFKKLLSRLSAASEDCIRGLSTLQCDYRLVGREAQRSHRRARSRRRLSSLCPGNSPFIYGKTRPIEKSPPAPSTR